MEQPLAMLSPLMESPAVLISDQVVTQTVLGVLAIFTSMIGLMIWLIKRQTEQVEKLMDRFSTTLEDTIGRNTEAQIHTANVLMEVTTTLTEALTTLREFMSTNRANHVAIMDAIGKVNRREP